MSGYKSYASLRLSDESNGALGSQTFLNPLGGLVYSIDGPDSATITVGPPPALASPEWAAQMAELTRMLV